VLARLVTTLLNEKNTNKSDKVTNIVNIVTSFSPYGFGSDSKLMCTTGYKIRCAQHSGQCRGVKECRTGGILFNTFAPRGTKIRNERCEWLCKGFRSGLTNTSRKKRLSLVR
jgi:hypothetical protein